MALLADLDGTSARDREAGLMALIGRIARGEITAEDVRDEDDLRQLAYLSALARNRVPAGGDRLGAFLQAARDRLDLSRPPGSLAEDPLQALFGARYHLDPGKLRSEGHLHI